MPEDCKLVGQNSKLYVPNAGFKIKYRVAEIPGKGKGLIATEPIKKGSLIWVAEYPLRIYSEQALKKELTRLNLTERKYILNHGWGHKDKLLVCYGDCELWNYSSNANCGGIEKYRQLWGQAPEASHSIKNEFRRLQSNYALRDIEAEEELTDNYKEFDNPQWYLDLCEEYEVESVQKIIELYS